MKKIVFTAALLLSFAALEAKPLKMVKIGGNLLMAETEITQSQYEDVMKVNPSEFKGKNLPVECVNWYDAVCFCNLLSEKEGLIPVYTVDGQTDTKKWNYKSGEDKKIIGDIQQNLEANGYRLPTDEERIEAAKGGSDDKFSYSGSSNPDDTCWYEQNSDGKTHEAAQKKPNAYGLYDMSGNVSEWAWKINPKKAGNRWVYGGSYQDSDSALACFCYSREAGSTRRNDIGFRVVRKSK